MIEISETPTTMIVNRVGSHRSVSATRGRLSMSEPAGPLLSRRAALIAGTVTAGTAWIAPLATSVSMTTAQAASGAPDSVRPPGQNGSGGRTGHPKQSNHRPARPKPPGHGNGNLPGRGNGSGNAPGNGHAPGRGNGQPKAPTHNHRNLSASSSSGGRHGHVTRMNGHKGASNPQWFGRAWVWVKNCF